MSDKGKPFWYLALVLVVCTICCLARPAPSLAGATISSDVISAAGGQANSTSYSIHDTFGQDPIGPVAVGSTIQLYDGFWSALAVAAADTIPPDSLLSFAATALDENVFLQWTVPTDPDLSGTLILYKTSGFPTGPDDGTPVENGASGEFPVGSGQSFTHAGLTNGTTYYYAAFDHDVSGNYSAALTDSATPFDGLAPGPLTSFTAVAGDGSVTLSWTNPSDADFELTVIRYSTSDYPTSPTGGLAVGATGSSDQFVHSGLANGTTYYYAAFAADEVPNFSMTSRASATPGDTEPPGPCPTLVATAMADGSVRLRFVAPSDADVEGVLVRYAIGYVPITIDAGQPLPGGTDGRFDAEPDQSRTVYHTGLVTDTTYYYSVWAFDEVPNYSDLVSVGVRPQDETPPELALSVFQNPYLTQYLDIYLIGSEALTDSSVHCWVDGDEMNMDLADSDENVWMGNFELEGSGTISLLATAMDISLNRGEVEHEFTSTLVLQAAGGIARSPDGRIQVSIPPGALSRDAYILVSPEEDVPPEVAAAYRISPPGIEVGDFVEISMNHIPEFGPIEHLSLARLDGGEMEHVDCYVDREHGRVLGFVKEMGTYGLVWNPDVETPDYGAGEFTVLQNVPNPFAGTTSIAFVLPRAGRVYADVITIDGRLVTEICDSFMIPGRHTVDWDGRDSGGKKVAGGVYFYRVIFESDTNTKKMVSLY